MFKSIDVNFPVFRTVGRGYAKLIKLFLSVILGGEESNRSGVKMSPETVISRDRFAYIGQTL